MRVFVTGATGFVGSAVVQELIAAGHEVTGLARNDANEQKLKSLGAKAHHGDLTNLEALKAGARSADAVIHCGFIHDFSKFQENCAIDKAAIEAMGEVLAGTAKPILITSGTGLLPGSNTRPALESDNSSGNFPRKSEAVATALFEQGLDARIVRLPPSVHGDGDHGFIPILINLAREKGEAAYTEDGSNVWPAVHRFDAARAYRLILEKGHAGARYHVVGEAGIPFKQIATAIGKGLNLPVVSKTKEDSQTYFGWFAHFAAFNNLCSSEQTRKELGWQPTQIGLIEDMIGGSYFKS